MTEQLELSNFIVNQYEDKISSLEGDIELLQAEVRMQEIEIAELKEGLEDLHAVLDEIQHDANVAYQTPDEQLDRKDEILADICNEAKAALTRVKI